MGIKSGVHLRFSHPNDLTNPVFGCFCGIVIHPARKGQLAAKDSRPNPDLVMLNGYCSRPSKSEVLTGAENVGGLLQGVAIQAACCHHLRDTLSQLLKGFIVTTNLRMLDQLLDGAFDQQKSIVVLPPKKQLKVL